MITKNNITDQLKRFIYSRSALSRLLQINIAVFILVGILNLFFYLYKVPENMVFGKYALSKIAWWLAVPADTHILLQKPWTLITYMFLHYDFMHIFFNMIMLYFGGTLFMQFLGGKKLVSTYIAGGIAGALLFIFAFNVFPVFSEATPYAVALGASASVLSILIAIAVYMPDYVIQLFIFGRVKLKHIALVLVVMDVLSIDGTNPGGHIAHLGGALWGFTYIMFLKKNMDMYTFFNPIRKFFTNLFKPKPKLKVEYKRDRPVSDEEYNKKRAARQKQIDAILDKIKISGYDTLTKEEKELLFNESNKR
jgi:membrane associated rhomboid family serine protease